MSRDVAAKLADAKPDLVFNALHGTPGEDGSVQGMLDLMGLRYTHSGLVTSVIAIDKVLTKQALVPHGIPMPGGRIVKSEDLYEADPLTRPYVLKPVNEGSSVGVAIVTAEGNYGNPIGRDVRGPWQEFDELLAEPYVRGRELTTATPKYPVGNIVVGERNDTAIRAFREDVVAHLARKGQLVDVRSPEEYRGERLHMPDYPNEGALRGGHIPGAKSVPWARAVNPDTHTFRPASELTQLYINEQGLKPENDTIAYCRIGERSSHTWFALTYLLGFKKVRNYDGSWTEWGNAVRMPIEK
jgi:rhodanese-related sulfurtransferase